MQDLILFGIQGSGKGTQARMLAEKYGYKIFETGKELRSMAESSERSVPERTPHAERCGGSAGQRSENLSSNFGGAELLPIASGSPLGNKVKAIIEAGNLVPDEVVIEIVEDFLKRTDKKQSVIFDGLPRKVTQKDLFEKVVEAAGRKPLGVLIAASDKLALKRLSGRHMSKKTGKIYPGREAALKECPPEDVYQRADDTPEAIKTRLKNYHQETQPVIDWYRERGRLVEVNGQKEAEEVMMELIRKLKI